MTISRQPTPDSSDFMRRISRSLTASLTRRHQRRTRISRRLLVELQARLGFTWEQLNGRYRNNRTGRFVAERAIIETIDTYHDDVVAPNIRSLTQRMTNGTITVAQWQEGMQKELKDSYIISVQAGRGGKAVTTQADYGRQGGRLNFEYRRLDSFAAEIVSKHGTDDELSPAMIEARAQLYAGGSRTAYFDGKTAAKVGAGFTEERRFLGDTDHCVICIGFAARGWVPIGTLPEPGTECLGLHQCGCDKVQR